MNCQRAATVLVYLTDVRKGGETVFMTSDSHTQPKNGPKNVTLTSIHPKRGRVVLWYNVNPADNEVDERSLHAGLPVKKGKKIAATVFIRNCSRL